jgi:hypothetical protein
MKAKDLKGFDVVLLINPLVSDCHVKVQLEYDYDPWKIKKLLTTLKDCYPIDAITRLINLLTDVRKISDVYKTIIVQGGDEQEACTELHKIRVQDKSIYLAVALQKSLKIILTLYW